MPVNAGTMRTLLVGICMILFARVEAQVKCPGMEYLEKLIKKDASLPIKLQNVEAFIRHVSQNNLQNKDGENASGKTIRIPVIVHILYNNSSQNITDEQVKSQIDALNRDYRRQNADSVNTPERFKNLAADVNIEFALATADPDGRPTTGILHKITNNTYFYTDDKIKSSSEGGDDPWDTKSYLNIWVGNLMTVLGYSSFPGSDVNKDGIVIKTDVFGTIGVLSEFNMGRTAVHEVGHWLGLKHVWGDSYCGDDGVDDTPKQGNYTNGCPGGEFRSSCDNAPLGDMYMNYMDFTDDACMNLFTKGQKARMLSLFYEGGPRAGILSSKGLNKPWIDSSKIVINNISGPAAIKLFPNPANKELTLKIEDISLIGKTAYVINISGLVINKFLINSLSQKLDISNLGTGIYIIKSTNGSNEINQRFIKL